MRLHLLLLPRVAGPPLKISSSEKPQTTNFFYPVSSHGWKRLLSQLGGLLIVISWSMASFWMFHFFFFRLRVFFPFPRTSTTQGFTRPTIPCPVENVLSLRKTYKIAKSFVSVVSTVLHLGYALVACQWGLAAVTFGPTGCSCWEVIITIFYMHACFSKKVNRIGVLDD